MAITIATVDNALAVESTDLATVQQILGVSNIDEMQLPYKASLVIPLRLCAEPRTDSLVSSNLQCIQIGVEEPTFQGELGQSAYTYERVTVSERVIDPYDIRVTIHGNCNHGSLTSAWIAISNGA